MSAAARLLLAAYLEGPRVVGLIGIGVVTRTIEAQVQHRVRRQPVRHLFGLPALRGDGDPCALWLATVFVLRLEVQERVPGVVDAQQVLQLLIAEVVDGVVQALALTEIALDGSVPRLLRRRRLSLVERDRPIAVLGLALDGLAIDERPRRLIARDPLEVGDARDR